VSGVARVVLATLAFFFGHVLAAVLAAIHAFMLAGLAHLHVLLMLHLRIGGSRCGRLGSGNGGRGN
jgi:hypothetical protein